MHGTLTVILPYIHNRIRSYGLSRAWPDAPSSDRRRKMWELLVTLESSYALLGLASFVTFLWNGQYVTSSFPQRSFDVSYRYRTIADRLFNMRLIPARRLVQRDVSYEFMNRQMVWHAFTVRSSSYIRFSPNSIVNIFDRNSSCSSSHSSTLAKSNDDCID